MTIDSQMPTPTRGDDRVQVFEKRRRDADAGVDDHGRYQDAAPAKSVGQQAGHRGEQHHPDRGHGHHAALDQVIVMRYVPEMIVHQRHDRDQQRHAHHCHGDRQQQHDALHEARLADERRCRCRWH
jgi:hypothetical protein